MLLAQSAAIGDFLWSSRLSAGKTSLARIIWRHIDAKIAIG